MFKIQEIINMQDENGDTALHFAASSNKQETVRSLIDLGADISLRNKDGRTALHNACDMDSESVIEEMLKYLFGLLPSKIRQTMMFVR